MDNGARLPGDILIRPMNTGDLTRIMEIERACFTSPWSLKAYQYELTQNPNAHLWVAAVSGSQPDPAQIVVGVIVLWQVLDELHIGTLAVHPNYQRQGIAQKLLAFTLSRMTAKGALYALLEVRVTNIPAQQLYQKFGFQIVGRRRGYYQDTGEDALLMTAVLDSDLLTTHYQSP